VAKYEMKEGLGRRALSKPDGLPWTTINLEEAAEACKRNGVGYELIPNSVWTSLAIWNDSRRTHVLSTGEIIWDLSGNVAEWVSGSVESITKAPAMHFSRSNLKSPPFSYFGPRVNCDKAGQENEYCGFGSFQPANSSDKFNNIVRGGHWKQFISITGIFTTSVGLSPEEKDSRLGFRCIYRPLQKNQ
jgi:hypothetical protein